MAATTRAPARQMNSAGRNRSSIPAISATITVTMNSTAEGLGISDHGLDSPGRE